MNDAAFRLSDAERDAAAADLGEHFAQGRLTAEEHAERLDRIWSAKTRGEVAPIFRDLPSPYAAVAAPHPVGPVGNGRYWSGVAPRPRRGLPGPLGLVLAVLIGLTVLTHLPLVVLGLGVWWFVVLRHRGRRLHPGSGRIP